MDQTITAKHYLAVATLFAMALIPLLWLTSLPLAIALLLSAAVVVSAPVLERAFELLIERPLLAIAAFAGRRRARRDIKTIERLTRTHTGETLIQLIENADRRQQEA